MDKLNQLKVVSEEILYRFCAYNNDTVKGQYFLEGDWNITVEAATKEELIAKAAKELAENIHEWGFYISGWSVREARKIVFEIPENGKWLARRHEWSDTADCEWATCYEEIRNSKEYALETEFQTKKKMDAEKTARAASLKRAEEEERKLLASLSKKYGGLP